MITRFIDWFIPNDFKQSEERFREARVLVSTLWIIYIFTINYAVTSYFIDYPPGMVVEAIGSFWYLAMIFLFKATGKTQLVANLTLLCATFCITVVVIYAGGFSAPTLPWLAFPPLVALLISNKKYAWMWLIIVLTISITVWVMAVRGYEFPVEYNQQYHKYFTLICAAGLIGIMFLIVFVFESAKTNALDKLGTTNNLLHEEKTKSDNLLSNILPEGTIKELRDTGSMAAKHYDLATVFFADIKGFTKLTQQMSPQELINSLHLYFKGFDDIMIKHKIEKIKTIGDAYVAAGGVPIKDTDNAERVVNAAQDCLAFVEKINRERKAQNKVCFDFRIGVHSGPLIAGVVGKKKFAYDIWGDTVNTAARMEQSGEIGKINISQSTYDRIKNKVKCIYRGKHEAKNKGQLDMYFVA